MKRTSLSEGKAILPVTFKNTVRKVISQFSMVVLLVLMGVTAMISSCKKSSSPPPPGGVADETLRFVFMADSRGDSMGYPIDTTALNPIIRAIAKLSPKPSFIMFGGDMAYRGYMDGAYTFQTFKNLFKPLADSGIALYTAIGNHELYHHHASYGYLLVNQKEYQKVFSENPSNGPAGYERLAYSFTSPAGNCFFAVLDPYFVNQDTVHMGLGGHIAPPHDVVVKNTGGRDHRHAQIPFHSHALLLCVR